MHPTLPLRRALGLFLATFTLAAVARSQGDLSIAPPMGETVDVELVTVEVRVTDEDGRPLEGLRRGDFRLLEDGKAVTISHFAAVSAAAAPAAHAAAQVEAGTPGAAPVDAILPPAAPAASTHLLVYVDDQHLRPGNRARILRQVSDFAATHLQPTDRVSVVTDDLGLEVRLAFSIDRAALERVLLEAQESSAGGYDVEASRLHAFQAMMNEQETMAKKGQPCGTSVVDPVRRYAEATRDDALRTLARLRFTVNSLAGLEGRKALLYVSDGFPLTPGEDLFQAFTELCAGGALRTGLDIPDYYAPNDSLGGAQPGNTQEVMLEAQRYGLAEPLRRLAAHANANGVTFYTMQASGLQGTDTMSVGLGGRLLTQAAVVQVLRENLANPFVFLAAETGGRAMLDGNDYGADLVRMREDLGTYYSLGFTPRHHGDGKEHRLEVTVKTPGTSVDYRRNYRDKPALEQAIDRTMTSLMHGFSDNPLQVIVEPGAGTDGGDGSVALPLHIKIPIFKLLLVPTGNAYTGKLRLLVMTRPAGGEPVPMRQVEVPLVVPKKELLTAHGQYYQYDLTLRLLPGEHRVALTVRDEVSSVVSNLARSIVVTRPPLAVTAATPQPQ